MTSGLEVLCTLSLLRRLEVSERFVSEGGPLRTALQGAPHLFWASPHVDWF
jgi:hypothetical protein